MMPSEQIPLFHLGLDLRPSRVVKSRIMEATLSANTIRNYRSSWKSFQKWCLAAGRSSMPTTPQVLIDHAAWCIAEGLRLETVELRLKAANHYHKENQLNRPYDEEVRQFMRCAKRDLCERPQGKEALTPLHLRKISKVLLSRNSIADIRDRAIILLCFACGWRCSELVSLDLRDMRWVDEGVILWLGKSKTDQEGRGRSVAIQFGSRRLTCPLEALKQWLSARGSWRGPLFTRSGPCSVMTQLRLDSDGVRRAVKRALNLIGEDSQSFGAHSLRVGMITAAVEAGATETSVMQRTGHKQYETLRRYVRPGQTFRANPLAGVL